MPKKGHKRVNKHHQIKTKKKIGVANFVNNFVKFVKTVRNYFYLHHRYRGNKTIVEKQGDILKLVSGPEYQPSFQKGLYCANIVQLEYGVNKVCINFF